MADAGLHGVARRDIFLDKKNRDQANLKNFLSFPSFPHIIIQALRRLRPDV
jgi:hypothetical protein